MVFMLKGLNLKAQHTTRNMYEVLNKCTPYFKFQKMEYALANVFI